MPLPGMILVEIIEERYSHRSKDIPTRFQVVSWHEIIGDPTIQTDYRPRHSQRSPNKLKKVD